MVRRRNRGIRRRRVECPGCENVFMISWRPDVRRFRAQMYGCPECSFFGRRCEFNDPFSTEGAATDE